jgi:tetratricopeptide (TPR) repeat protein
MGLALFAKSLGRSAAPITLPKAKSAPYIRPLMKFGSVLYALGISASLLVHATAQGTGPDDLYLHAYELIQTGDELAKTGQSELARQRYSEAEANLKKIQQSYPNYSKQAVEFRLDYVGDKLKSLPARRESAESKPAVSTAPQLMDEKNSKALLERLKSLQAENAMLQAKLQEALAPKPASVDPNEFAKSQERIQQLEKEKELLRVQVEQARAKQPQAGESAMAEQLRGELEATRKQLVDNIAAVATLTQERNALRKQSEEPRATLGVAQGTPGSDETANLRARLAVYEAKKIPFTAEELALMNKSISPAMAATSPAVATPGAKPAPPRELPAGAGLIVAEAERLFAQRKYGEAEEKYKQVLRMDENNPVSLANLAAIQLEMQKFNEADANLKKAVELNPQDAYALSLLGMLRFQQNKYEEALDALSRSAQFDPKNAETQNYLGITLSQRGQREAAETALRKAITLNPNYAGAHHNLAVIYATQKPPFVELARFHYNKARTLGQAANADLEKQLGI